MSRFDRFVIECRKPDGTLDLTGRQPHEVFGLPAIQGISEDDMAKIVFRHAPDATLSGMGLPTWPARIDPRWQARRKTW